MKRKTATKKDEPPPTTESPSSSSSSSPLMHGESEKKKASSSSASRRAHGGAGRGVGAGVNPCVVLVALMMVVGGVFLVWEASIEDDAALPLAGHARHVEGGRLAASLRHWPNAVSHHHSEGA